ncbi:MAG: hypothetical protein HYV67_00580 [Candidatus Taylorbacteria bacterium]|nr:hypothetical protein [Candidatus Taylorbacteria bacterium]
MSIKESGEKIKSWVRELLNRIRESETGPKYYTAAVIILVGLSSFGLGRLSVIDENRQPIIIEQDGVTITGTLTQAVTARAESQTQTASVAKGFRAGTPPAMAGGKLVASKNGTKYYYPWCASNIADKNKIWFNSEAEARAKGYQPAANCKGLK